MSEEPVTYVSVDAWHPNDGEHEAHSLRMAKMFAAAFPRPTLRQRLADRLRQLARWIEGRA